MEGAKNASLTMLTLHTGPKRQPDVLDESNSVKMLGATKSTRLKAQNAQRDEIEGLHVVKIVNLTDLTLWRTLKPSA